MARNFAPPANLPGKEPAEEVDFAGKLLVVVQIKNITRLPVKFCSLI
jgi:hypothetical protein